MGSRMHSPQAAKLWPMLVVGSCFLLGGVLGCFFSGLLDRSSANQVQQYLIDYISLIKNEAVSCSVSAALWNQGRWILFCVLFGLTGIGLVALPVLFAVRGFLLVFSISCFVRFLGGAGIILAALIFGIPALLWAPVFFLCGMLGLLFTARAIQSRIGISSVISAGGRNLRRVFLLSAAMYVLCVCVECALLPILLPAVARILG